MERHVKVRAASDERQYMIHEEYEVFEKQGPPTGAVTFHYHNFYEVIYVMEGSYSSMVENQTYDLKKGDFLFINTNVMHRYYFEENADRHETSKRIILWITPGLLAKLAEGAMPLTDCFGESACKVYHFPVYYEELLRGFLMKLSYSELFQNEQPGSKAVADRSYLGLFFVYLNNLCRKEEYTLMAENVTYHPLVEQVNDYVEQHLGEQIPVEVLADYVHMSKFYFIRKFKELTGVTVHGFVNHKKMIRAAELLREGKNINTICQETGYQEYTVFLRNFKKAFGVSPGKYLDYYGEEGL